MIKGLFDIDFRLGKIDKNGDPRVNLNKLVRWELFRYAIDSMREKERKSNAGRKLYDSVMMVKMVILQSLYNLSDAQMEQQVLDRLSFMRFLGLSIGDNVPDEKQSGLLKKTSQRQDSLKSYLRPSTSFFARMALKFERDK